MESIEKTLKLFSDLLSAGNSAEKIVIIEKDEPNKTLQEYLGVGEENTPLPVKRGIYVYEIDEWHTDMIKQTPNAIIPHVDNTRVIYYSIDYDKE